MAKGKRPRGRPQKRWKDRVRELLEDIGVDWEQAYDRERWKEVVLAALSLNGSYKPEKKRKMLMCTTGFQKLDTFQNSNYKIIYNEYIDIKI